MSTFEIVARDATRIATGLPPAIERATRTLAERVKRRVQQNASGSPGPERVTGQYVSSITVAVEESGGVVTGTIGTDEARAERLEYGYHGTDALGRNVNAPPYPHWRPAAEWADTQIEVVDDAVARVVR